MFNSNTDFPPPLQWLGSRFRLSKSVIEHRQLLIFFYFFGERLSNLRVFVSL